MDDKLKLNAVQSQVHELKTQLTELFEVLGERLHGLRIGDLVFVNATGQTGIVDGFRAGHVLVKVDNSGLAQKVPYGDVEKRSA